MVSVDADFPAAEDRGLGDASGEDRGGVGARLIGVLRIPSPGVSGEGGVGSAMTRSV